MYYTENRKNLILKSRFYLISNKQYQIGVVPKLVREQSAKLLYIGSNPFDTSKNMNFKNKLQYIQPVTDLIPFCIWLLTVI